MKIINMTMSKIILNSILKISILNDLSIMKISCSFFFYFIFMFIINFCEEGKYIHCDFFRVIIKRKLTYLCYKEIDYSKFKVLWTIFFSKY